MANIHIIIPDAHSNPHTNPRRFAALGHFLADFANKHRNDNITTIELGDFEDMPSLSSWDFGKMSFEGRRFIDDIETAKFHRALVYEPINDTLATLKTSKRKSPVVKHIACGGNHFEGRINKYLSTRRELEGLITLEPYLEYLKTLKIKYVPYQTPVLVDGISYVHYWENRGNQKPIGSGMYPAAAVLRHKHTSSVVGHSHVLDRASAVSALGNRILSIVAGCYLDPEEREDYAGQANDQWWKGIIVLRGVESGYPTLGEEYIPVERIISEFL